MIQIERNHLYMISIGSEHGVVRGDIIAIYRAGVKVAEARLISVLPDSSMAEMYVFFNVTDVFESDSVHYISNLKTAPLIKPTLSSERKKDEEVGSDDSWVSTREVEKSGLLGSDTSIGRQVHLAKQPLEREIAGLKMSMETLREDFDGRMGTVLDTVKGGASRAALKQRKKLIDTENEYKMKLTEQREALEAEFNLEKDNLERKIIALTKQINDAGVAGDQRAQQLVRDLKSTEIKINRLRESYDQQRSFDEGGWLNKISELEEKYQIQLRNQQDDSRRELILSNSKYEDEITLLKDQFSVIKNSNKRETDLLRKKLGNEQDRVETLRDEKTAMEKGSIKKNTQLVKSKKEIIKFKDLLNTEKASYGEKIRAFKLPYEREIKELKKEIALITQDSSGKVKLLQKQLDKNLSNAIDKQADQLSLAEEKHQLELNQLKKINKEKNNSLQAKLDISKAMIKEIERDNVRLISKLKHNAKNVKQLTFDLETLTGERADILEKHEQDAEVVKEAINEDKSLIKFLNNEMATLTDDIEDKDQQIAKIEKVLTQLGEKYSETKSSHQSKNRDLTKRYENEIKDLRKNARESLSTSDSKWQTRLVSQGKEYQQRIDAQKSDFGSKFVDLKNQISAVQGDSSAALAKFQGQLKERGSFVKSLEEENTGLKSDLQQKSNQKTKLDETIAQLNEIIEKNKQAHSKEVNDFRNRINNFKGDSNTTIKNLQEQIKEKAATVRTKDGDIAGLNSELQKNNTLADNLKDTIAQLNKSINKTKLTHSKEIVKLDSQIKTLAGDSNSIISELQGQLKDRGLTNRSLENQITSLSADLDNKTKSESRLSNTIALLNDNIEKTKLAHAKEITHFKNQVSTFKGDSNTAFKSLQEQLKENISSARTKDGEIAALNAQLQKKNAVVAKLKGTIVQSNESMANIQLLHSTEIADFNNQISTFKGDSNSALTKIQGQLKERNSFVNTLENRIVRLNSKLKKKGESVDNLKSSIVQLNDMLEQIKLEHSGEMANFNNQINTFKGDNNTTIKNLQGQLQEKRSANRILENRITILNSDLQQKSKQGTRLEDVIDILNGNIKNAKLEHSKEITNHRNQIHTLNRLATVPY